MTYQVLVLDGSFNLPQPLVNVARTAIEALAAAQEVRAILGRGVVLKGRDLPADTIVVIVGEDLKAKDLQ